MTKWLSYFASGLGVFGLLALVGISHIVYADARVDTQSGACHWPKQSANTDAELVGQGDGLIAQQESGLYDGACRIESTLMDPYAALALVPELGPTPSFPFFLEANSVQSGATCTLIGPGQTQSASAEWSSLVMVTREGQDYRIRATVRCSGGSP